MPARPHWKPIASLAAVLLFAGASSALGTFSAPVDLSATGGSPDGAQIAIGADGEATAVWSRSNGSNYVIQAATPRRVGGIIRIRITSTGAGRATVTGTADGRVACVTGKAFTSPGSAVGICLPEAWVQRRRLTGPVKVTMTLAFRPSGAATTRTTLGTLTLPKRTLRTRAVTG